MSRVKGAIDGSSLDGSNKKYIKFPIFNYSEYTYLMYLIARSRGVSSDIIACLGARGEFGLGPEYSCLSC